MIVISAQLTKRPSPNHYFLKDDYEGKQGRLEQALMYMTYKDVKARTNNTIRMQFFYLEGLSDLRIRTRSNRPNRQRAHKIYKALQI
ncbi:hypothetical protein GLOIN_2v1674122 [Rhizophagus irregularis DAOM 181602=DAOM 197198]|nr:hypothetical protein GLOIN_2v1674122 [Rhizophagus irregularis DAOM 181602=DAOM 197198]